MIQIVDHNPVRQGLVRAPKDWEYFSFYKFVREGKYGEMWGAEILRGLEDGLN